LTATVAADTVALGTDTTGNYVASITNGSYITGGNGGSEGAALTLAVDATTTNTASKVVARDASGDFAAGTITAAAVKVDTTYNLDSATATVASLTQTAIASFSSTTFGGGKVTIQAFDSVTGARTMCELLIVHNGTTASATEYGIVNTGASAIATYDVDINTGNVRILANPIANTFILHFIASQVTFLGDYVPGVDISLNGYVDSVMGTEDNIIVTTEN
jgi:hypothetical protein